MDETTQATNSKSPVGAALLSAFFPTLGLFYAGNKIKGLAYLCLMAFLIVMVVEGRGNDEVIFGLLIGAFHIYQIFDSYDEARHFNRQQADIAAGHVQAAAYGSNGVYSVQGGMSVSLFWAITILVVGIICQLAELGIIRYRDVSKLWPLVLIGLGAKYILGYLKTKEGGRDGQQAE